MESDDIWADMDDFDQDSIPDLMEMSDAELVNLSAASRTPKIMSIRHQSLIKNLSEKQRYCLAFWIDENHPDFK